MIIAENNYFILHTKRTTYACGVLPTGHLEHYYYGRKISTDTPLTDEVMNVFKEKHAFEPGNSIVCNDRNRNFTLEDVCLEMSSYGNGDIREPFIELCFPDGSYSPDFLFESASVTKGKQPLETLPSSYGTVNETEHLQINLKDSAYRVTLELHYYVFEDCDVIVRSAKLRNTGTDTILIKRLMSSQLDFPSSDYVLSSFHGAWAREMHCTNLHVQSGKHIISSYTGTSSNRANPFVMLSAPNCTEDSGSCYGMNLIYSGNHYTCTEVNAYSKTRLVWGISPVSFCYELEGDSCFETPEAVITFSANGFNGMSQNMHSFIRNHIVRGFWKEKERPVLLNSWEAAYFSINENKLLRLAKAGADVGIELFVMDDGWFGKRNDDTSSLGDWEVNEKKIKSGLPEFVNKVNALGLSFGIWVEPEMVSVNSDLYRAHPDWAMEIPGKHHCEGRNQRVLDLTRKEVQDYIIEKMSALFSSANIAYVKWDMNRIITDYYSRELPPNKQGEVAHRYQIGLYRCMKTLTESFPEILFEGCASGGNRFDLGILCSFPQIWASDNTDALCRAEIQNGYSYGYPPSVYSAHVSSCPNHQTLRTTPLETRFHTSAFGICGYECNFSDMKKEELEAIKEQITLYKKWRNVLQFGTFYRGRSFRPGSALADTGTNLMEWTCVSKNQTKAVGFLMQALVCPNTQFHTYFAKGLDPDRKYHFTNRTLKYNIKEFGDLVNTVAPIHIKQDSLAHNIIARFVKMDGEIEDYSAYGDTLMYHGVKLKQAFSGTGYNGEVRFFQDFSSRMYFMES